MFILNDLDVGVLWLIYPLSFYLPLKLFQVFVMFVMHVLHLKFDRRFSCIVQSWHD